MKWAAWLKRVTSLCAVVLLTLSGLLVGIGRADLIITGVPNKVNRINNVPSGTVINIDVTSDAGKDAVEPADGKTQSDTLVLTFKNAKENVKATCTLTENDENNGSGICSFTFPGMQWKEAEIARAFGEGVGTPETTSDIYIRDNTKNSADVMLCSDDNQGRLANVCAQLYRLNDNPKFLPNTESFRESPTALPEPSALALLLGVLGVAFVMLQKRFTAAP